MATMNIASSPTGEPRVAPMTLRLRLARLARGALLPGVAAACVWSCGGSNPAPSGATLGTEGRTSPSRGGSSSGGGVGAVSGDEAGAGSSGAAAAGGSSSGASGGGSSSSGSQGPASGGGGVDSGASPGDGGDNPGPGADSGRGPTNAAIGFSPDRSVVTGVRGLASPAAMQTIRLHNGGLAPVQVASLAVSGVNAALFQPIGLPQLPATLMPGSDLPITLQLLTAGTGLPPPPPQDSGSTVLAAGLTATWSAGSAQAPVYGLVLTTMTWEPTLGEILGALGYKLNVGLAQNNANPNRGRTAQQLPGVEPGTDEVAAPLFVKAGAGNVTMTVAARFSPRGVLPYGFYPATDPTTRNVVGTMDLVIDPQTNDKARLVWPPLAAGSSTTFDPGTAPFGIWVYTDEVTQRYAMPPNSANAINGDYDYSQDALNTPANVHRFKAYPLKDASGVPVPNTYLLAVEEATNGDYQDYVFVLGNVHVSP